MQKRAHAPPRPASRRVTAEAPPAPCVGAGGASTQGDTHGTDAKPSSRAADVSLARVGHGLAGGAAGAFTTAPARGPKPAEGGRGARRRCWWREHLWGGTRGADAKPASCAAAVARARVGLGLAGGAAGARTPPLWASRTAYYGAPRAGGQLLPADASRSAEARAARPLYGGGYGPGPHRLRRAADGLPCDWCAAVGRLTMRRISGLFRGAAGTPDAGGVEVTSHPCPPRDGARLCRRALIGQGQSGA
jgi:hypothetical protein